MHLELRITSICSMVTAPLTIRVLTTVRYMIMSTISQPILTLWQLLEENRQSLHLRTLSKTVWLREEGEMQNLMFTHIKIHMHFITNAGQNQSYVRYYDRHCPAAVMDVYFFQVVKNTWSPICVYSDFSPSLV